MGKRNEIERVLIFDTTLRDGEQAPGCGLEPAAKLQVAHQLARLGVDVIEGGFPVSSLGDFEAVRQIAKIIGREPQAPEICGLARCVKADIDSCWEAVKYARRPRIHVFIATSDIHLQHKLRMSRQQVLDRAVEHVRQAKKYAESVEFSPEDAVRSDRDYLAQVLEAVVEAGATTLNIPDTVGYSIPEEFGGLIAFLLHRVRNIDRAVVSVHCHNDLGLAVANSLAAVKSGARQVECTVNGLGERAGNAAMEEIVMAIRTRKDLFGLTTGVNTREIHKASRLVSTLTGMVVQPNKAVVGANAFAHSSGIHQDGYLKHRQTYEIMEPGDVGIEESSLLLTARSGRHALENRLKHLGYKLGKAELDEVFGRFKTLADKKKYVFDDDLLLLVEEGMSTGEEQYTLDHLQTSSGTGIIPTATLRVRTAAGQVVQEASCGDGPVDATYNAVDKITGLKPRLLDYNLRAISKGKDAQGEVTVRIEESGFSILGRGSSTDIIEASAKAYLNALNKLALAKKARAKAGVQGKV